MDFRNELRKPIGFDPDTGALVKLADALTWDKEKIKRFQEKPLVAKSATQIPVTPKRVALKEGQFAEVDPGEVEYEFGSPNAFLGTHGNLVPMPSAVQGTRVFYGARFANQALPLIHGEAPLVQNLSDEDPQGRSFDEILGKFAGAISADDHGQVTKVTPDELHVQYKSGLKKHGLYSMFPLNRKTFLHHTPLVKEGDAVIPGQMLAKSNFTDDKGVLNLGVNVRVGLVPYKGHSMDDAVVISEPLSGRLTSNQLYGHDLDYKRGVKGGKAHYTGIFPNKFTNSQLEKLDKEGVAKSGATLNPGDPIILATRPRVISSNSAQLGKLSVHMRNARADAAVLWDKDTPGKIVDVEQLRNGVKVNVATDTPVQVGDKLSFRSGGKMIVSKILPEEHMPRTVDGKPLEMLVNPLSIPSRVNNSLLYEVLLGKAAAKNGAPYKVPSFTPKGKKWHEFVEQELQKAGLQKTDEVFDPVENRKLENPITTGMGFVQKLSHTSESKMSVRGQGAYDVSEQPLKGHDDLAKSKRLSGLESNALLSSGAYNVLREGSTLRGQRNDDYWRQLRMGYDPQEPGEPFVFNKMKALMTGSGYAARAMPGGKERLGFYTDKDLDQHRPLEVRTGDIVDMHNLEPIPHGLFDPAITGGNKFGYIALPDRMPNPAAETVIMKLLGITEKKLRAVLAGEEELDEQK